MAMDVALFFHLLGVATLFVALGITEIGGSRLRHSKTLDEFRTWSALAEGAGRLFGPAFILILGAGVYMAQDTWGFDRPFVVVGLISIALMIGVGAGFVGRTFTKLARSVEAGEVRAADIPGLVARPSLWATNVALDALAIGVIWDMVRKPDWAEAIAVVAGLAFAGAVVGALSVRRVTTAAK
jgi:hypothetical protein